VRDQIERVRSFVGHEDNLRMWGQLFISQTGHTVGGWLLDSWSENGAPYWLPKLHWYDKADNKLYHVYMDGGFGRTSMNLHGEDEEVDPKREKFILGMLEKWELEWLQDEAKKS
jgi:hypothetical protein